MCKQFNGAGCWLSLRPKRTGCDKQAERTALRAARRGALRKGVVGPGLKTLRELLGAALCAMRYTSAEQLCAQEGWKHGAGFAYARTRRRHRCRKQTRASRNVDNHRKMQADSRIKRNTSQSDQTGKGFLLIRQLGALVLRKLQFGLNKTTIFKQTWRRHAAPNEAAVKD